MFAVPILACGYVILCVFTTTRKEHKMISTKIRNNSSCSNRGMRLTPMYNDRCFSSCEECSCQIREVV